MVIPDGSKIENEIKEIAGRLGGAVNLVAFVSTRKRRKKCWPVMKLT